VREEGGYRILLKSFKLGLGVEKVPGAETHDPPSWEKHVLKEGVEDGRHGDRRGENDRT